MYPQAVKAKTLARLLQERTVVEANVPLSKLKTIGGTDQVNLVFDGTKILEDITKAVRDTCPQAVYTSTTPMCVYTSIDQFYTMILSFISQLESCHKTLKPIFVFDGCGFAHAPDMNAPTPDPMSPEVAQLNAVEPHKLQPQLSSAVMKATSQRFKMGDDLEALIVRRLHEVFPETFRAPYLAWSQISAFFAPSNLYASEVYGSVELLAFPGIERVITKIDPEKGTFDCVSKAAMKRFLSQSIPHLSDDDFSALLLLDSKVGQYTIYTAAGVPSVEEFFRMHDASVSRKQRYVNSLAPVTREAANRNLAALYAPVLTADLKCVPLSVLYGRPHTGRIDKVFGKPMPDFLYALLFSGAAMPTPYAALTQRVFFDDWPLVDTAFFRGTCERVLPLRVQICFQLFQSANLHRAVRVRWLRQYQATRRSIERCWTDIANPPSVDLCHWEFDPAVFEKSPANSIFYTDILPLAECATSAPVVTPTLRSTLATALLKSLDLIGYFTHASEPPEEASGMCSFSKGLSAFYCPTLSEYGVLLIELVRTGTLTDMPIPVMPTPSMNVSDPNARVPLPPGVRFAARAVSIIPINLEAEWSGPVDPEMAAFGAASRLFGRTLRLLTEVSAACVLANRLTTLGVQDYWDVVAHLPFGIPIEFNAGILMLHVLTNPTCTIQSLSETFPAVASMADDLGTLFWFWSMTFSALCIIVSEEKDEQNVLMDPYVLMEAHQQMSLACGRLLPEYYEMYFAQLGKEEMMLLQPAQHYPMQYYDPSMDPRQQQQQQQYQNYGGYS